MNTKTHFFYRHLPHYQPDSAIYSITFRLFGSLPPSVIIQLKEEYAYQCRSLSKVRDRDKYFEEKQMLQRKYFEKFDEFLEAYSQSPTYLVVPEIAQFVADALRFWEAKRYDLVCYCIMPNHVHLVIDTENYTPIAYPVKPTYPLSRILESIKRYTARRSNEFLGRGGKFWQKESYDHVVRNGKELDGIIRYVIENPVKAGLVDSPERWRWTYFNENYFTY